MRVNIIVHCVPQLWICHENLSPPERGRSTTFNVYSLYVLSIIYICDRALKPKPQFEVSQFSKVNKTISDGKNPFMANPTIWHLQTKRILTLAKPSVRRNFCCNVSNANILSNCEKFKLNV